MRILYHHRTQSTGVERVHIFGIVNSWRALGHEVTVLSPPGVAVDSSPADRQSPRDAKSKWRTAAKLVPKIAFQCLELLYNLWGYLALFSKLGDHAYDLLFERYSFLCLAGALAAKHSSTPFFVEVNYTFDTPIFRNRTRLFRRLDSLIEAAVFRRADAIFVVSTYLKQLLVARGYPANRIVVLPNAADPALFQPITDHLTLKSQLGLVDKRIVGFVGSFFPWHGLNLLLDTYESVREAVPNVVYLLAGDGPTYNETRQTIKSRRLDKSIILLGRIPHNLVATYIGLFDVAVMPQSNNYGSPMKILEYMAMGKTVVAPRLGPIQDVIQDDYNGLLFDPDNRHQFVKRILDALRDEHLRSRIGKEARTTVLERHNWSRNAEKILFQYSRLYTRRVRGNRICAF